MKWKREEARRRGDRGTQEVREGGWAREDGGKKGFEGGGEEERKKSKEEKRERESEYDTMHIVYSIII